MANGMEQQAAPAQGGQADSGGGQFNDLVSKVSEGMSIMADLAGESGMPPQISQALEKVQASFQAVAEAMVSGGGAPQQGPAPSQPQAPEAGASGAQPAGPQGVV
jgi:hypothetical protein